VLFAILMQLIPQLILATLLVALVGAGIWLYTPDRPRADLEAKYSVSRSDYIDAAGMRVRLHRTGPRDAPAIILIHGFGASLETWKPWVELLGADHDVISFDLPGFGLTGPDPTGNYTDARAMEVLSSIMKTLCIARASLIGNSLGGKLAWMFAARYPAQVDKLVLISPDGFASPGFDYGVKPKVPAILSLSRFILPKAAIRMTLAPAYADPSRISDETVSRYWDFMRAPGVRRAILDRMAQAIVEKPEPILATIQTPTLLLWGEKDEMIPFANAADYMRVLPNATLVALPNLGHVPQEENPMESFESVRIFLDR
jgi:pimeloyl-ACP methyl ester carboxylesterase